MQTELCYIFFRPIKNLDRPVSLIGRCRNSGLTEHERTDLALPRVIQCNRHPQVILEKTAAGSAMAPPSSRFKITESDSSQLAAKQQHRSCPRRFFRSVLFSDFQAEYLLRNSEKIIDTGEKNDEFDATFSIIAKSLLETPKKIYDVAQFLLAMSEQSALCTFFLYFPQASRRCCGLLVSSPVLCFSPG